MWSANRDFSLRANMTALRPTVGLNCALLLVALLGCGPSGGSRPTAHLQGKVTIGGKPVPPDAEASVTFKPTKSGQARSTSAIIKGGTYDAPDVPVGPVTAYVSVQQATGKEVTENVSRPYKEYRSLVPAKYNDGIPLEVTEDSWEHNFDL
jgi:hypothetical protein